MIVILNPSAGVKGDDRDTGEDLVRKLFQDCGGDPRIVVPKSGEELVALARDASRDSAQTVVAGGGDGTISAVASALAGTDRTLGVLPMGTLNHFAKDLSIPLTLPDAVKTIMDGRTRKVDVGEVNGRVFINNSGLGIYPQIVADREHQQKRFLRGKWTAFFRASVRAFTRYPFMQLKIDLDGRVLERKTAFLFVGNNAYEIAGFDLGARSCMDAGRLGLYMSRRTGRLGLIRLGVQALFGRLSQATDFDALCVTEASIKTRRKHLLVATDGEVNVMETPLHYRIRPQALRVKTPATGPA